MATTLLAALEARLQELACHDRSCAPPPVGTGGSKPSGGKAGKAKLHPDVKQAISWMKDRRKGIQSAPDDQPDEADIEAATRAAKALRAGLQDGTRTVRVRISSDILERHVLSDGRLKDQRETGHSKGAFEPDLRDSAEYMMFGPGRDTDPIYGYIGSTGRDNGWVSGYGDVALELRPEAALLTCRRG
jgi:hypothetical protein